MKLLFFNIGWMEKYEGWTDDDPLFLNGFENDSYDKRKAGEQYNFKPYKDNYLYGYVPLLYKDNKWIKRLDLGRIGCDENAEYLEDVTVIFFSRHQKMKGSYIVGFYLNSTVFRTMQEYKNDIWYICKTKKEYGYCVPINKRYFKIPYSKRTPGGFGHSPVWYADNIEDKDEFQKKVLRYIDEIIEGTNKGGPTDIDKKMKIEKNAVDTVKKYYTDLKYSIRSVEKDNIGYDLIATQKEKKEELFIEVKGLSQNIINIQLTPNEYKTLKENHEKYKVAIVTNALEKKEKDRDLHIFSIYKEGNTYYGKDNNRNILEFEEKINAIGILQNKPDVGNGSDH